MTSIIIIDVLYLPPLKISLHIFLTGHRYLCSILIFCTHFAFYFYKFDGGHMHVQLKNNCEPFVTELLILRTAHFV